MIDVVTCARQLGWKNLMMAKYKQSGLLGRCRPASFSPMVDREFDGEAELTVAAKVLR